MNIHELVRQKGLRLNLSPRTIKTYQHCLQKFFRTIRIDPIKLKKKDIEKYIHRLMELKRASSTINVYLSALKFFYEKILHKTLTIKIEYQKRIKRLPEFLTQNELHKVFNAIQNPKHLLMIKFLYATGIRVSELTNMKVKDLQLDENYAWVRQGKGRKDRPIIIAKKIKLQLKKWINKNQLESNDYLFFSYYKHKKLSTRTIQAIVKKAQLRARIKKNIHPHTFRHSFATHLIEQGNPVTSVQPLLGHNSINTTMRYLHLARPMIINVQSPLDYISL
ncbi:hypothetical protein CL619_03490 [archaeon]|nr:hypothetical protein [archaeon]|tara:strand:+ start:712 stop:1545 length:834 start_codon:yes stop_codon:yes gene_type:complete